MATNGKQAASGWSESINVAGVSIEGGKVEIPAGVYKCKTVSVERVPAKSGDGSMNLKFTVAVTAPKAYAGTKLLKTINPTNEKARFVMKKALLSHGVPAASLEKGDVKIGEKTFVGKDCFMSFEPAAEGQKYYNAEFITPDQFSAASAGATSKKHAGATATANETDDEAEVTEVDADEADDLL